MGTGAETLGICDKCPQQAQTRVEHGVHKTTLEFCAHHTNDYFIMLFAQGFRMTHDFREDGK